jgi:hypothetical protein
MVYARILVEADLYRHHVTRLAVSYRFLMVRRPVRDW